MGGNDLIINEFYIRDWKVIIIYQVTCYDIDVIIEFLKDISCPRLFIEKTINNLESCNLDIGFTYSNLMLRKSVIAIGKTSSDEEIINSISHEYFHLLKHLEKGLDIKDEEQLAKLNGELNMKSYKIVKDIYKKVDSE